MDVDSTVAAAASPLVEATAAATVAEAGATPRIKEQMVQGA